MILGQLEGNLTLTEDSARVSSVSTVDLSGGDDYGSSSTSGVRLFITIIQLGNLLLTLGSKHHFVHLVEDFLKGFVVLLSFESLKLNQLRHQMLLHVKCYFLTYFQKDMVLD